MPLTLESLSMQPIRKKLFDHRIIMTYMSLQAFVVAKNP